MSGRMTLCLAALAVLAWPALTAASSRQGTADEQVDGNKIFNVLQFGAISDGSRDDQQAIRAALSAAAVWTNSGTLHKATVLFPPGIYNLEHIFGLYAIDIENMHDISLQGQACDPERPAHCTMLIGAPASLREGSTSPAYNSFVKIEGSRNIGIHDFYMDKAVPYYSQGQVLAVDTAKRTVDVAASSGYMTLEDPLVSHQLNIVSFFPATNDITWDHDEAACRQAGAAEADDQSCPNFHIISRVQLSTGHWRFGLDRSPLPVFAGGRFLLWKNLGWQYGIFADRSANIAVSNIFYTGGGGPAVHFQGDSGLQSVSGLTVDVPAGSGRLFAATSGLNGTRNRGTIRIRSARVRAIDDDAFHFSGGTYDPVVSQDNGGLSATVALCYDGDFQAGDRVGIWNWHTKMQVDSATVEAVRVAAPAPHQKYVRVCTLTLDKALRPLSGLQTYDPARLGVAADDNDRISNLSASATLVVQDSAFSSMRAHCGIIQISAVFLHNRCHDTPFAGLLIGPEYQWGEGFAVHGVQLNANTFDNIGGTAIRVGDIYDSNRSRTRADLLRSGDDDSAIDNTDITITNNTFSRLGLFGRGFQGVKGLAISIENAAGVTIQGNRFPDGTAQNVVVASGSTRDIRH